MPAASSADARVYFPSPIWNVILCYFPFGFQCFISFLRRQCCWDAGASYQLTTYQFSVTLFLHNVPSRDDRLPHGLCVL